MLIALRDMRTTSEADLSNLGTSSRISALVRPD
jgi:hypothetical protein